MKKNYFYFDKHKWFIDFHWLRFDLDYRPLPIPVDVIFFFSFGYGRVSTDLMKRFVFSFDMLRFKQNEIKYKCRFHISIPIKKYHPILQNSSE